VVWGAIRFKSKSELTVAALEAEWNKTKANMDALFSPTVPPLERFDRYFDRVHDRLAAGMLTVMAIVRAPHPSHINAPKLVRQKV